MRMVKYQRRYNVLVGFRQRRGSHLRVGGRFHLRRLLISPWRFSRISVVVRGMFQVDRKEGAKALRWISKEKSRTSN